MMPFETDAATPARPPVWTRLHPWEIHEAAVRVAALAAGVERILNSPVRPEMPTDPTARVTACLQTTGCLLVQARGRQPVLAPGAKLHELTTPDALAGHVRWQPPKWAGYLPLQVMPRWHAGLTPREVATRLARWGLDRARRYADYPDRLSGIETHHTPAAASSIIRRQTPGAKGRTPQPPTKTGRKPISADPTRPLSDYATEFINAV